MGSRPSRYPVSCPRPPRRPAPSLARLSLTRRPRLSGSPLDCCGGRLGAAGHAARFNFGNSKCSDSLGRSCNTGTSLTRRASARLGRDLQVARVEPGCKPLCRPHQQPRLRGRFVNRPKSTREIWKKFLHTPNRS